MLDVISEFKMVLRCRVQYSDTVHRVRNGSLVGFIGGKYIGAGIKGTEANRALGSYALRHTYQKSRSVMASNAREFVPIQAPPAGVARQSPCTRVRKRKAQYVIVNGLAAARGRWSHLEKDHSTLERVAGTRCSCCVNASAAKRSSTSLPVRQSRPM